MRARALSQVEECMWAALERSEDAGEDALIPAGEILSILVNLEASDAE